MNSNLYTKKQLIQEMKNYIYESKFCTNNTVFSRNYLTGILFNKYSNNNNIPLYSIIYGDFNKLGNLNQTYGFNTVNIILNKALQIIRNILPKNAKMANIAGDEFIIFLDAINNQSCIRYIEQISDQLNMHSEELYGLSISLSSADSIGFNGISDMYFCCEDMVSRLKHTSTSEDEKDTFNILESKIHTSLLNFLDYYRLPENFEISKTKKQELEQFIISILSDQLEITNLPKTTILSQNHEISKLSTLSQKDAIILDYIFNMDTFSSKDLEDLNYNSLHSLLNYLTRENTSNEFSKKYFFNYLLPQFLEYPETTINLSAFYLTHLKLSNEVTNHPFTDSKISQMHHNLCDALKYHHHYEENTFLCKNNSNFLIQYGPNIISILRDGSKLSQEQIKYVLQKARDNQNILNLVALQTSCKSTSDDILYSLDNLSKASIQEKEDIKIAKFNHPNSKIALEAAIQDSICYYKNNIPNWTDMHQKQKFLNLFINSLTKTISENYNGYLEL